MSALNLVVSRVVSPTILKRASYAIYMYLHIHQWTSYSSLNLFEYMYVVHEMWSPILDAVIKMRSDQGFRQGYYYILWSICKFSFDHSDQGRKHLSGQWSVYQDGGWLSSFIVLGQSPFVPLSSRSFPTLLQLSLNSPVEFWLLGIIILTLMNPTMSTLKGSIVSYGLMPLNNGSLSQHITIVFIHWTSSSLGLRSLSCQISMLLTLSFPNTLYSLQHSSYTPPVIF